ncbi:MAG: alpha/beta fold hydrolase [Actinomycetes bacterium]
MRKALIAALAVGTFIPAAAQAAEPTPFGNDCVAKNGVRFCQGAGKEGDGTPTGLDRRPTSFDGTPIDADVTLPPTGNGPWPTVIMIHGYGQDKNSYLSNAAATASGLNNVSYAARGYAVVTVSMRGFGMSCGRDVRTRTAGCDKGYIHLMDTRYEARDAQHLLGKLVDEGIADPTKLASLGASYGGGATLQLAYLKNRIRNANGSLSPWTSPLGTPLSLKAGWAMVPWSNLASALTPNGRFLDYDSNTAGLSITPAGVPISSYLNALYLGGDLSGWYAPAGTDPDADITTWKSQLSAGEPFSAGALANLKSVSDFHGGYTVGGKTSPLLLQSGWTDDLFPPAEALRVYSSQKALGNNDVRLIFNDLGHARSQNKPDQGNHLNTAGAAFLDSQLKGIPGGPAAGSAAAMAMTCNPDGGTGSVPVNDPAFSSGPAVSATSWEKLRPNAVRFTSNPAKSLELKRVGSSVSGGDDATAFAIDPIFGSAGACGRVADLPEPGVASYKFTSKGFSLLGLPTIKATIATTGTYGVVAARLWDVSGGKRRLVTRGVYRLNDKQSGTIRFQLHGNYYRFNQGNTVKLELLPKDRPYLQTSKGAFKVTVRNLTLELPTKDAKSSRTGVTSRLIGKFVR